MQYWSVGYDSTIIHALIAQGDGGPELGGGGSNNGNTAQPGDNSGGGGAPGPANPGTPFDMWIPLIVILGAMMIFVLWRQRKEQKNRDQLLSSVQKRDRVQTIGGVIGSVVEVKANTVVLKVDESSNTRMTFARSAIQQILTDSPDRDRAEESAADNTE